MYFKKNSAPFFIRAIVFSGSAGLGLFDNCTVSVKLPDASHQCREELRP
jgi:hypothetical protein